MSDGFVLRGPVLTGVYGVASLVLGWSPVFFAFSFEPPSAAAMPYAAASLTAPQGSTPVPGEIAVSEILFNPATLVDDNDGEYFEITNISTRTLDFSGLYIQDSETPGSPTAPYFQVPAGALPLLYPGDSFVFARSSDPLVNGGIPTVDYAYSVLTGTPVPADKSKVSHTGMALSNSAIDAIAVTTGAPQNMGGFVIEMVTYDPTKAPLTSNNGLAFERSNLNAGWVVGNIAASVAGFGTAFQSGTPGAKNSNDSTLYSTWYKYDFVNPLPADTGTLLASGPASVHYGAIALKLSGGAPLTLYAIGFAPEQSTSQFFDGTCLIDLTQAHFWALPEYQFDGQGVASLGVTLTPGLVGKQFWVQWYGFDASISKLTFSNALGVDIVE